FVLTRGDKPVTPPTQPNPLPVARVPGAGTPAIDPGQAQITVDQQLAALRNAQERDELQANAERLQADFTSLRTQLGENGLAASLLPNIDATAAAASKAYESEDFASAVLQYTDAVASLRKIRTHLTEQAVAQQKRERDEAVELQTEFQRQRQVVAQDPAAAAQLKGADALATQAETFIDDAKFADATNSYQKAFVELARLSKEAAAMAAERLAKQKALAAEQKQAYTQLRLDVGKQPEAAALLPNVDIVAQAASQAFVNADFDTAVRQYKAAIDELTSVKKQIEAQHLADRAAQEKRITDLRARFTDRRAKLAKDAHAAGLLQSADTLAAKAATEQDKADFAIAVTSWSRAIAQLDRIENEAAEHRRQAQQARKQTADTAKTAYSALRLDVAKMPQAVAHMQPVDAISQRAVKAYLEAEYEQATTEYKAAIAELKKVQEQVAATLAQQRTQLREKIMTLQTRFNRERVELSGSPSAAGKLPGADEQATQASVQLNADNLQGAVTGFQAALTELASIREEVAELARQERLVQQAAAEKAKQQFATFRLKVGSEPLSRDLLPDIDAIADSAVTAFLNGNYADSANRYKAALTKIGAVDVQVRELRKKQQLALREQSSGLRTQFNARREVMAKDANAAASLPRVDDLVNRAAVMLAQGDYKAAVDNYRSALAELDKIQQEAAVVAAKQLKQQREAADVAKQNFLEQRLDLGKRELAQPQLARADDVAKKAREAFDAAKFIDAQKLYREAIDVCHTISEELKGKLRTEATALQATANSKRRELEDLSGLSQRGIRRRDGPVCVCHQHE
ncbi:MAG: hypothetical protein ACI8W8_002319, partial [Rhodothermales bacterium]